MHFFSPFSISNSSLYPPQNKYSITSNGHEQSPYYKIHPLLCVCIDKMWNNKNTWIIIYNIIIKTNLSDQTYCWLSRPDSTWYLWLMPVFYFYHSKFYQSKFYHSKFHHCIAINCACDSKNDFGWELLCCNQTNCLYTNI